MDLMLIRVARRLVGLVGIALFLSLAGFSLVTHLAPVTGHQLFIITGGSMEPTIPLGSLVIVSQADASTVVVGDVITVRADNGVVVTHRVHQVIDSADGRFFETKGDKNQSPDASLVPARALVGAVTEYLPYAGYAHGFLSTVPGLLAAVGLLGACLLAYVLLEMLAARRHEARARRDLALVMSPHPSIP